MRAYLEWHELSGSTGLPRGPACGSPGGSPDDEPNDEPDDEPKRGAPSPPGGPGAEPRSVDPSPGAAWSPGPDPIDAPLPPRAGEGAPLRAPASEPAQASPGERLARLAVLAEEVKGCQKCALAATRTQTVFARGNPRAEVCFVGEGPGADEDAQGLPFVGKAGQLLDRMIVAMGMHPDDVYVANVVKCRPPNNRKPEPAEMAACLPYLTEQLGLVGPKVIVALGATAVQGLFGTTEGITRIRGQWRLYRGTIPVMPTFHPAYLLRNPSAKREVWTDLKEVLRSLGRPVPER